MLGRELLDFEKLFFKSEVDNLFKSVHRKEKEIFGESEKNFNMKIQQKTANFC